MISSRGAVRSLADGIMLLARSVLLPYQLRWLDAIRAHTFVSILGGRQIGKDFTLAYYVALVICTSPNRNFVILSASNAHAGQFIRDVRQHLTSFRALARELYAPWPAYEADNVRMIALANGSSVVAVSNTTEGVTGTRGSVIFNEVPLVDGAEDVFPTALSQVERANSFGRRARLVLVGNASRTGSFWHTFWQTREAAEANGEGGAWGLVRTPWSVAIREQVALARARGFTLEDLRPDDTPDTYAARRQAAIVGDLNGNVAAFLQWFECVFRAPGGSLFSEALLKSSAWDDGATYKPKGFANAPQVLGYDVGLTNDPSVLTPNVILAPDEWLALPGLVWRNVPAPEQRERIRKVASERKTRGLVLDGGGIGKVQLQDLAEDLGTIPLEGHTTTGHNPLELFGNLKTHFEKGIQRWPKHDTELRMQLESIAETTTLKGNLTLEVPRSRNYHSDKAVSLALACLAAKRFGHRTEARAAYGQPATHGRGDLR